MQKTKYSFGDARQMMDFGSVLETVDEESAMLDFEQTYQILPPRMGLLSTHRRRKVAAVVLVAVVATTAFVASVASFPWPSQHWQSEWLFGDYPAPVPGETDDLRS